MERAWVEYLRPPEGAGHAVQTYAISTHMPRHAERVLAVARAKYTRSRVATR